ncbi:MAG: hypothetical protein JSW12_13160 [Deltaproteobacteria bacterium]|nr:MAG: hypothetical protein JSW12_13160 [Deltaproteobacteria bacterium]
MNHKSVVIYVVKGIMPVFERRYLKKDSTGSCSGQICGVYTLEALGVSVWFI